MSCINITPLVLSDTFNTWFERTNESISALNSFEIRGLSASTTNGVRGLKFVDAGSCYYSLALETGPFVGFVTGEDSGIYGTGDAVNPYKLTLVATGPTMSADSVTGDDYVLVSDTSDSGLFKLAPVSSFDTNIVGGNNISVTFTDGTYTISYVEITFAATFTVSPSEATKEIGSGTLLNNAGLTFTINTSGSSDVNVASASVRLVDDTPSGRFNGAFGTEEVTISGGSGSYSTGSITVPHNTEWFNLSNTSIQFSASITSDTQTNDDPPLNTSALNTTATRTYTFGWAFGGFASTTSYDSNGVSGQNASLTDMKNSSNAIVWGSIFYSNPTTKRQFNTPVASSAEHYVYFVHSSSQTGGDGDTFGWTPTFYNDTGAFEIDGGFTELTTTALGGPITVNNKKYRVWRSVNTYTQNFTFQVD
jgi:hypothetical protein